eukprot:3054846-Rhodomonas_salina.2
MMNAISGIHLSDASTCAVRKPALTLPCAMPVLGLSQPLEHGTDRYVQVASRAPLCTSEAASMLNSERVVSRHGRRRTLYHVGLTRTWGGAPPACEPTYQLPGIVPLNPLAPRRAVLTKFMAVPEWKLFCVGVGQSSRGYAATRPIGPQAHFHPILEDEVLLPY